MTDSEHVFEWRPKTKVSLNDVQKLYTHVQTHPVWVGKKHELVMPCMLENHDRGFGLKKQNLTNDSLPALTDTQSNGVEMVSLSPFRFFYKAFHRAKPAGMHEAIIPAPTSFASELQGLLACKGLQGFTRGGLQPETLADLLLETQLYQRQKY
eukprot:527343-Pelagomonas_calceolata.AAC.1